MDDAMADRHDATCPEHAALGPSQEEVDGALLTELCSGGPLLRSDRAAVLASDELGMRHQAVDLSGQQRSRRVLVEKCGKLQARRTRVQHEQYVRHFSPSSD